MQVDTYNELLVVLENIKISETFQQYGKRQKAILADKKILAVIDTYSQAKAEYSKLLVEQALEEHRIEARENLRNAKTIFDKYPIISEYYRNTRKIELFIDDLNYEINTLLKKEHKCLNK